ncbi:MAG: hypothetical protein OEV43_05365 [Coriobacteriia bacterium]|nr:hypothetical protein [Coriobacteriia bacterium]
MLRWVFLIAWTMHGLGHVAGVLGAFLGPRASGFKTENPWVLPGNALVTGAIGKLWSVFWLASVALIVASSWGLFQDAEWWRQVALYGSIASLIAILPWVRTVVSGALAGAAFSAGVIVMLTIPLDGLLRLIER